MARIFLGTASNDQDAAADNFFASRNILILREVEAHSVTMEKQTFPEGRFIVISGPVEKIATICENLHDQYGISNLSIETADMEEREFLIEAMDDGFWQGRLDDSAWEEE